ncbi:biofilm development regulator YmgB/AriR family protein [Erwiniaceae bacterium L1_55_4]|jgi:probable RcsB/C two-component-system connector, global regulator of biofilm formation and acid-resistance|nr:biofilm development regulator YmgB/AriR family protein [Erwiniaceae bacterium L1_55_4]
MQQNTTEQDILRALSERGDQLAPETEVICAVLEGLRARSGRVLRKDIILALIAELESTSDVVRLDVLRGALEIVVGYPHGIDDE